MTEPDRTRASAPKSASPPAVGTREPTSRRARWAILALAVLVALAGGAAVYILLSLRSAASVSASGGAAPTFVGSEACAGCHRAEGELWRTSQHKQAMDHASEKSVRGDFSDASVEHFGVRSRFYRRDGKFLVETDGPDGKLASFEVKYTFGIDPLQQYLV